MSSLASQLAAINSRSHTVLEKKKKKSIHSVSLVFDPQEAAGQDYETIFYYSLEALRELEVLDPRFEAFENSLFAESAISVDRLVQVSCVND